MGPLSEHVLSKPSLHCAIVGGSSTRAIACCMNVFVKILECLV